MEAFLASLVARFEALEGELNALDAATGDGDHGSTMIKGLRAAAAAPDAPEKAFRRAAGGASGSLFAVVIGAFKAAESGGTSIGEALGASAERVAMLGQAKPGDKTMLDALGPASAAKSLSEAIAAARAGLEGTRDMAAKRGRAKHVENAGVGHLDAGATSVVKMLEAYADHVKDAV